MKLCFTTNGWYDLSWGEFVSLAKEMHFQGIEIHNLNSAAFTGRDGALREDRAVQTARRLQEMGLSIPCLDTLCNIADTEMASENAAEIEQTIAMAQRLRAPYIRLHASHTDTMTDDEEDETVITLLHNTVYEAERAGVTLLIETSGIYADTLRLRNILNTFASDSIAVLWDMHHPYRYHGESAQKTIENLGAYVKHVHMRDSVVVDGEVHYRLMGEGDIPFYKMIDALRSINYEGYYSMEWDPAWLEGLGDAQIVFPNFVHYMSRFEDGRRSKLYNNRAHTGKFMWKKDTLIDCTFSQVLDRVIEEFPDQYAFKYATLDYTRTYSEFRDDVDTFARALIALGVKAGSHVTIWATNIPQWFITFWAVTKIGATLVTMNTAYKIHEAEYLLKQSDTHTLVMTDGYRDSNYVSIINELCPELAISAPGQPLHCKRLPFLRNVVTVSSRQPGCLTWDDALSYAQQVPVEEVNRRASQVNPHDVCNMQYTSGTTGFPKGVMLTHYNIVNNGKCIGDRMDLSTADRLMIHVPMFHCFGMVLAMTAAMTHGTTMLPLPYFSPKPALACINQEHITAFHGVPTMFIAMLEHEDFKNTDFSYMRTGIMAGSPCPIPVMKDVLDKMHMDEITIVYGQTEASPGCTMSSTDDPIEVRVGTVGRPLPEIECKIVDPETGEDQPVGVTGEFVARGYNLMKGYYKMPEATAAAIDEKGWLHTGDLACKTPEGNYRITGRLKDMIIRGGENIYPKEIEEFIYTHPKVKDVQVIGVPDQQYGEEIMACVILKAGVTMDTEELRAFVQKNMAKHKVPRYVDFVEEFPMNVAGKILKYKMREDAVKKLQLGKAASIETA